MAGMNTFSNLFQMAQQPGGMDDIREQMYRQMASAKGLTLEQARAVLENHEKRLQQAMKQYQGLVMRHSQKLETELNELAQAIKQKRTSGKDSEVVE